jgi:glycosyltransferase involved in cell wall biosynthesis
VGFVGRVSQIKDVPTLIRAMGMVIKKRPGAKLLLVGPGDEEPEYYEQCKQLARELGIGEDIDFAGSRKVTEELWKMDTLVLTSLSEGLPFVILEAFAVGIPCISTDVGSCRMVIEGNGSAEDDKPAGYITRVGMPHETADAILKLLGDRENCERLGQNGLDRVVSLYRQSEIMAQSETIYHELSAAHPGAARRPA